MRTLGLLVVASSPLLLTNSPERPAAPEERVAAEGAALRYTRDVRPILSERCFLCHGPDGGSRKARLRLDQAKSATADRSGSAAIVPGRPEASLLLELVREPDPEWRMPPEEAGPPLTAEEIATLEQWISEGAEYETHWAYSAPARPETPRVSEELEPRGDIDAFVFDGLASRGVQPAPRAESHRLARRVHTALTGLPPSLEQQARFEEEAATLGVDAAVDAAIERALDSSAYAEHWTRRWLDLARYADTHGYHMDNERVLWIYRDWVLEAFRSNKPYDRFVLEQLAGDLLPDADLDTRIATGFQRCNPTTAEGGLIDEEYLAKYAFDRTDTVATAFLGSTMGCARCHDHKYDPFRQKDYYALMSFFDDVAGEASDMNAPSPPPFVLVAHGEDQERLEHLQAERERLAAAVAVPQPELDALQLEAERLEWNALEAQFPRVVIGSATAEDGEPLVVDEHGRLGPGQGVPANDRWSLRFQVEGGAAPVLAIELGLGENGFVGRHPSGNLVLGEVQLTSEDSAGAVTAHSLAASTVSHAQSGFPIAATVDGDPLTGWALAPHVDEAQFAVYAIEPPLEEGRTAELTLAFESDYTEHLAGSVGVRLSRTTGFSPPASWLWQRTEVLPAPELAAEELLTDRSLEESLSWMDLPADYAGERLDVEPHLGVVYIRQLFDLKDASTVTWLAGSDDDLAVWIDGELVHANPIARGYTADTDRIEVELDAGRHVFLAKVVNRGGACTFGVRTLSVRPGGFDPARAAALLEAGGEFASPRLARAFRSAQSPELAAQYDAYDLASTAAAEFEANLPKALVIEQRPEPMPTAVLNRGSYDQPGELVESDIPQVFGSLGSDTPKDRLDLAEWITTDNPLFERVFVNWVWQAHFGRGLVETPEDFGSQGAWPSHPELLDWLAVRFRESGFDVKDLHRTILGSATWRQSNRFRPELEERDPDNVWLARGPRLRLEAEELRDSALALSGLLVDRWGGPPVRPYQPDGIWKEVAIPSSNTSTYERGDGDDLYRRSLYTFWKRTAPPPNMAVFDAPTREACILRREATNTPLQALALWNDVQFVEAARALALRMLHEGGESAEERAAFGLRLVTSRPPHSEEIDLLVELARAQTEHFASEPGAASELLEIGDLPTPEDQDAIELAAWTLVANALLNLDEVLHRG